jgi:hypothetical protein
MNKIVFEPGSFDDFEGTQEELDDLVARITEFLNSDEFKESIFESDECVIPDDEAEEILKNFNGSSRKLN